ncbi:hypothetical protein JKF63_04497 [Porcisia hertigi]|uniref:Uncharacterized protein n=1 Tax=Porcisia hertigi TaxID=2761500 RepID=A0A836LBY5_9TRYP|nr:hypothetical protein JKF63_04497 [Porcisia hertigi]
MDGATLKSKAGPRADSRADGALTAATAMALPSLKVPCRATAEQRKAYLEKLYGDYADLQSQREEIDGRKRKINFDMYESKQEDIQKLIFAGLDTLGGELGDWDTYEKVEAVVKRYAYGKPHNITKEREEFGVMQSRIDTLTQVIKEKAETEASLAQSLDAVQRELAGVLKLLHLKENEVQTLTNQNKTAKLQLRCAERDCQALRGFRSENASSQLREDMNFLIKANKALEQENAQLRRFLNAQDGGGSTASTHAALRAGNVPTTSAVDSNTSGSAAFAEMEDGLYQCIEDDAYRHNFLQENIPISASVVNATRKAEQCQRRLEAEVTCAMEMLDRDAFLAGINVWGSVNRGRQPELSRMENDTFVSYATYQSGTLVNAKMSEVPVSVGPGISTLTAVAAPQLCVSSEVLARTTKTMGPSTTKPSSQDLKPLPEIQQKPLEHQENLEKPYLAPQVVRQKKVAAKSIAGARVAPRNAAATLSTSTSTVKNKFSPPRSLAHTVVAPAATSAAPTRHVSVAQTCLKSAVLRCAELSRLNALRREVLHVEWFRQQLEEERNRVASLEAAKSRFPGNDVASTTRGAASQQKKMNDHPVSGGDEHMHPSFHGVEMTDSGTSTSSNVLGQTSAPERLRSLVEESRSSIPRAERDSDEVRGSAVKNRPDRSPRGESSSTSIRLSPSPRLEDHATGTAKASAALALLASLEQGGITAAGTNTMGLGAVHASAPGEPRLVSSLAVARTSVRDASGVLYASSRPEFDKVGGDRTVVNPRTLALEAIRLHEQMRQLGHDPSVSMNEMKGALSLLGALLEEVQLGAQHASEKTTTQAVKATAQRALEEAAVARAAQVLEKQYGAQLSQDFYAVSPDPLPDTATDEQWLAHELRSAALAMIQQAVRSRRGSPDGGRKDDADAPPQTSKSTFSRPPWPSTPRRVDAGDVHELFQKEILHPLQQWLNAAPSTAKSPYTPVTSYRDGHRSGDENPVVGSADEMHRPGRGGHSGQHPPGRTLLPMQWYSVARDNAHEALPPPAHPGTALRGKNQMAGLSTLAYLVPTYSSWGTFREDIQMIRPTVLRYDFNTSALQAQQRVREEVKQTTAYIFGSEFDDFVRQYILPIVSRAAEVSSGSGIDLPLRTAIRQLREEARRRSRRGVHLLFERVANNIRTRRLLRHPVFHGNSFVSYIGVLYNKWRTRLEDERHEMRTKQHSRHAALMSLMRFKAPPSATFSNTSPRVKRMVQAPKSGDDRFHPHHPLQASSYHFDRAQFSNK